MTGQITIRKQNGRGGAAAELAEADIEVVVGGTDNQTTMMQLISTMLKDLNDVRSSIIRNLAG